MSVVFPINPVLVIDDDEIWLKSFSFQLKRKLGITNVIPCSKPEEVMSILVSRPVTIVILDFTMPRIMGDQLLTNIKTEHPDIPVILLTGSDQVDIAVRCMQRGAFDYYVKSVDISQVLSGVLRAIKHRETLQENRLLNSGFLNEASQIVSVGGSFAGLWTRSLRMLRIFRYLEAVAQSSEPLLFTGEYGTGKATFAKALHATGKREGQFVYCKILEHGDFFPDALSGYRRGDSLLEKAAGGTIYLEGIEHLTRSGECFLTNLLESSQFSPLQSLKSKWFTGRIVASAGVPIDEISGMKQLMMKFSSHTVEIPALRERREDLPVLLDCFLEEASRNYGKSRPTIPPELLTLLGVYEFPRNVQEFRDMVFEAVLSHSSGVLSMETFKERISDYATILPHDTQLVKFTGPRLPTLSEVQDILISEACRRASGNQGVMADMLGISRTAVNKRLKANKTS
jgi:DNA-binding NtrC family response regulator